MSQSLHDGDFVCTGALIGNPLVPSTGCITDAAVLAAANIAASKLEHQYEPSIELFESATAITAVTKLLHIVKGATATIIGLQAAIIVQATGADRTVNVDLQRSALGGAFATVMTATVAITNATVIRTAVSGTVNPSLVACIAGDLLQIVITVAGAAGAQAKGLIVTPCFREKAQ